MATKEIWLPFKIHNFINLRRNGKWLCHVLIEEEDLVTLKDGTLYENTDDIVDEDLKAAATSHVFLGHHDAVEEIIADDDDAEEDA